MKQALHPKPLKRKPQNPESLNQAELLLHQLRAHGLTQESLDDGGVLRPEATAGREYSIRVFF